MDNRFIGELSTDVYGLTLNEFKLAHLQISAVQGVAADADGVHAAIASKTTATDHHDSDHESAVSAQYHSDTWRHNRRH